jgi:protein involved in polysaccharide export with SLBB domain
MNSLLRNRLRVVLWIAGSCFASTGCISLAAHEAVPVCDWHDQTLWQGYRDNLVPIDYGVLGQPKPVPRLLAPGDLISVYIEGVLPSGVTQIPVFERAETFTQIYYPPEGSIRGPSFGVPLEVAEQGTITLPIIGEFQVAGKSLVQVSQEITRAYVDRQILKPGREKTFLTLIKEGVRRVTVLREDTPSKQPTLLGLQDVPYAKIGNGQVVDLAVYQNDVLHAIAASGGLPGIDSTQEVFVIRRQDPKLFRARQVAEQPESLPRDGIEGKVTIAELGRTDAIRIPLALCPGEAITFSPDDVILQDGDTVYIPKREEYFYTAGLLPGRRVPLPRDHDVDILQAITLASGNFGTPTGITGLGPGNHVTPSLAVVIRKQPNGPQQLIRVDLHKALLDPTERVVIRPDDIVLLQYRPTEAALNMILNVFSYSFEVVPNLN